MIATLPVATVDASVHPRILARMKLVALARRQDMVLAQLDDLIARLDELSQLTDRFSDGVTQARNLRDQMVFVRVGSPKNLALMDRIRQHIATVRADLAANSDTTALSA